MDTLVSMRFEVLWLYPVLTMALGICAGYLAHVILIRAQTGGDARRARSELAAAQEQAETVRKEANLDARALQLRLREEFEKEIRSERAEITERRQRVEERETSTDRRMALLDKKEEGVEARISRLDRRESELEAQAGSLAEALAETRIRLSTAAGLTPAAARKALLGDVEQECRADAAGLIRQIQHDAVETAEQKAREILVTAIERYASDQVAQVATSTVRLPNDEMKGRIIGRDGRNIRSIEAETGCNILIDDTPGVAIVSAFDPVRREVARRALEQLVEDGRIHPPRIEQVVGAVRDEIESLIREAGEEAVQALELSDVAPEVMQALGRLHFRHSFAQNVLTHSVEVARLMGMMASELGLDPVIARRVGLFHDIGKAMDHSIEGGHAEIGADLLRRNGEAPEVVNAVAAHHHEADACSPYAALASAADALTAARPGARLEQAELYLERLSKIETIASEFHGVRQCYAVQAGRELRVLAAAEQVNDDGLVLLARDISRRLSDEVRFPGQIRVTVIRETRAVEYAR